VSVLLSTRESVERDKYPAECDSERRPPAESLLRRNPAKTTREWKLERSPEYSFPGSPVIASRVPGTVVRIAQELGWNHVAPHVPRGCGALVVGRMGESQIANLKSQIASQRVGVEGRTMSSRSDARSGYEAWMAGVPKAITSEHIWKFYGYRKSLYLYDLCWNDCSEMAQHPLGRSVSSQLIRSAGSIAANIEEGYGRGLGKDRGYFLRIALGSARESKGWYYRAKALLLPDTLEQRMGLLGEIIALLVTELNNQPSHRRP
jgi:four helix bundle protein